MRRRVLGLNAASGTNGLRYRVSGGAVVVAWSPNSVRDLSQPIAAGDAGRDRPGVLLDLSLEESGALVWLDPGIYGSTLGYHEEANYGVEWCLLSRLQPGTP